MSLVDEAAFGYILKLVGESLFLWMKNLVIERDSSCGHGLFKGASYHSE